MTKPFLSEAYGFGPCICLTRLMANRFIRMRKRNVLAVFCVNVMPGKRLCQITVAAAISRCKDPWGLLIIKAESEKNSQSTAVRTAKITRSHAIFDRTLGLLPLIIQQDGYIVNSIFPSQLFSRKSYNNYEYESWQWSLIIRRSQLLKSQGGSKNMWECIEFLSQKSVWL